MSSKKAQKSAPLGPVRLDQFLDSLNRRGLLTTKVKASTGAHMYCVEWLREAHRQETIVDSSQQAQLLTFIAGKKKGKAQCSFSEVAHLEEVLGEVDSSDDDMSFADFFRKNKAGPQGRQAKKSKDPNRKKKTPNSNRPTSPGALVEAPVQPVYGSREELARIPQAVPPSFRKKAVKPPDSVTKAPSSTSVEKRVKTVVVLGASLTGSTIASQLSQESSRWKVILVDARGGMEHTPGFLSKLVGGGKVNSPVAIGLADIVPNCSIYTGRVVEVDKEVVTLHNETQIPYDYLIVATGGHFPKGLLPADPPPSDFSLVQLYEDFKEDKIHFTEFVELCEQDYAGDVVRFVVALDAWLNEFSRLQHLNVLVTQLDPADGNYDEIFRAGEEEITGIKNKLRASLLTLARSFLADKPDYQVQFEPSMRGELLQLSGSLPAEFNVSDCDRLRMLMMNTRIDLINSIEPRLTEFMVFVEDQEIFNTCYFAEPRLSFEAISLVDAESVVVVGDTINTVQLACFIAGSRPDTKVVLLTSLPSLAPTIHEDLDSPLQAHLDRCGVKVFLNERVVSVTFGQPASVECESGRAFSTERVYLSGSSPNTSFMQKHFGSALTTDQALRVNESLQVVGFDNIFAVGAVAALGSQLVGLDDNAKSASATVLSNLKLLDTGKPLLPFESPLLSGDVDIPLDARHVIRIPTTGTCHILEESFVVGVPLKSINQKLWEEKENAKNEEEREREMKLERDGKVYNDLLLKEVDLRVAASKNAPLPMREETYLDDSSGDEDELAAWINSQAAEKAAEAQGDAHHPPQQQEQHQAPPQQPVAEEPAPEGDDLSAWIAQQASAAAKDAAASGAMESKPVVAQEVGESPREEEEDAFPVWQGDDEMDGDNTAVGEDDLAAWIKAEAVKAEQQQQQQAGGEDPSDTRNGPSSPRQTPSDQHPDSPDKENLVGDVLSAINSFADILDPTVEQAAPAPAEPQVSNQSFEDPDILAEREKFQAEMDQVRRETEALEEQKRLMRAKMEEEKRLMMAEAAEAERLREEVNRQRAELREIELDRQRKQMEKERAESLKLEQARREAQEENLRMQQELAELRAAREKASADAEAARAEAEAERERARAEMLRAREMAEKARAEAAELRAQAQLERSNSSSGRSHSPRHSGPSVSGNDLPELSAAELEEIAFQKLMQSRRRAEDQLLRETASAPPNTSPAPQRSSAAAPPVSSDGEQKFYPLSVVVARPVFLRWAAGKYETLITDEEFEVAFGMTRARFETLPLWKKNKLKQEAKLF